MTLGERYHGALLGIAAVDRGAAGEVLAVAERLVAGEDVPVASLHALPAVVLAFAATPHQAVAKVAPDAGGRAADVRRHLASLLLDALAGVPKDRLPRGEGHPDAVAAALRAFRQADDLAAGARAVAGLGAEAAVVYGMLAGVHHGTTGTRDPAIERIAAALVDVAHAHRDVGATKAPLPDDCADTYHATWFEYVDPSGRRFVARPHDAAVPAPAWDLPREIAVVTAWNPASAPRPAAANAAANARLRDELGRRGARVRDIVGRSAAGDWCEASFAVWNLPLGAVTHIAAAYGQYAIFVVQDGRRTLGAGTRRVDAERGVWLLVEPAG